MDDLEDIISNELYDYCYYVANDNKVLVNSTKILILCTVLFKLLTQYRLPEPKYVTGAQTDYENEQ